MVGEDRRALAARLRRLLSWEIRNEQDLTLWYAAAQEVNDWLKAPRSVSVPRELWRWLAEADLRFADPDYASRQNGFIQRYIGELESAAE